MQSIVFSSAGILLLQFVAVSIIYFLYFNELHL